jgi:hypothetical protein
VRVIVVQQASGLHADLLRLVEHWHRAYCERHGYEYRVIYGQLQNRRSGHWCKVVALIEILRTCEAGTIVIWLDADTIIEQPGDAIAGAMPEGVDVGMVPNRFGELNAGAIWIRASAAALTWLERVEKLGNTPHGSKLEQSRMKLELASSGLNVAELPSCWNAYKWTRDRVVEPAIIRAWHACPMCQRWHRMRTSLEYLLKYHSVSKEVSAHFERATFGG